MKIFAIPFLLSAPCSTAKLSRRCRSLPGAPAVKAPGDRGLLPGRSTSAASPARHRGGRSERQEIYGGRVGQDDRHASRAVPASWPSRSRKCSSQVFLMQQLGRRTRESRTGSKSSLQGPTGNARGCRYFPPPSFRRCKNTMKVTEAEQREVLQRESRQIQGSESPGHLHRLQSHAGEGRHRWQEASYRSGGEGKDRGSGEADQGRRRFWQAGARKLRRSRLPPPRMAISAS